MPCIFVNANRICLRAAPRLPLLDMPSRGCSEQAPPSYMLQHGKQAARLQVRPAGFLHQPQDIAMLKVPGNPQH